MIDKGEKIIFVGQGWELVQCEFNKISSGVPSRILTQINTVDGQVVVIAWSQIAVSVDCMGLIVVGNGTGVSSVVNGLLDEVDGVTSLYIGNARNSADTVLSNDMAKAIARIVWKFAWIRGVLGSYIIRDVRIVRRFEVPFRKKVIVANEELAIRKVAWMCVEIELRNASNEEGNDTVERGYGIGEIAPLEGYHAHSVNDACKEVEETVTRRLVGTELDVQHVEIRSGRMRGFMHQLFPQGIGRCTQLGIECALIHAIASASNMSLLDGFQALSGYYGDCSRVGSDQKIVGLNGIIPRTADSAHLNDAALREQVNAFKCFKIKIGKRSPNDDAAFVCGIARLTPPTTKLRLDANQAWTLDEYRQFCTMLKPAQDRIEYIEEPLQNPLDLLRLPVFPENQFPRALDDSLIIGPKCRYQILSKLTYPDNYQHMVIHPLFMSGLCESFGMLDNVRYNATIACAYDSSLGICWLALFAAVVDLFNGEQKYHGLASHTLLEDSKSFVNKCVVDGNALDIHACEEYIRTAAEEWGRK